MKKKIILFASVLSIFSVGYLFAEKEVNTIPTWSKLLEPIGNTDNKQHYKKDSKKRFKSSQLIVKFKERAGSSVKDYAVNSFNGKVLNDLDESGISQVELREGQTVEEAVAEYSNHPDIEFVQPNYVYHASVSPNDTQYGQLWGLNNTGQTIATATYGVASSNPGTSGSDMKMENAWAVSTDCSNMIVAIVDSGVNYNHTELSSNMWSSGACVSDKGVSLGACANGWDYADNDSNPMDLNGHGTHVAGTIGARGNNASGTTGICWTSKIMAVRVLDQLGSGDTATIIKGINFAVKNGAKVLNLSLGGPDYDNAMRTAMVNAGKKYDALFVVAAGNESNDLRSENSYPCEYPDANILCVAALDQKFQLASFSNFDTSKKTVDIGAPGTNIVSSWAGAENTYTLSFASWTKSNFGGTAWTSPTCPPLILMLSSSCSTVFAGSSTSGYQSNSYSIAYAPITISSTADAVTARMNLLLDTESGYDGINMYASKSSSAGTIFTTPYHVGSLSGETNGSLISNFELAAPDCANSSTCSFGFEFVSDSSINRAGVAITSFSFITLDTGITNQYNTINGTSMATPHVTGLATLLRSFNPRFTYSDTIKAIIAGGTTASSLQNITKYGKAANGEGAMKNLEAPTDLTVDVP
ncbi:S8 family serine peptidase [Leptospira sarikeiensis]|uniref:Peptidase S8 n=1 Tax=Leptospira sarikeiensis TaxID=2484943 RepID=A0A4R9K8C2_9LEPT|nr:S8 family serine peptidase [Leptospira sarikeiensis]TGL62846.1 peptidase S8 [Leptospira sarikeiensis]